MIGLVITGTTPSDIEIITEQPQSVGTYVKILHQEGNCLGLIEKSEARSESMNENEMTDWETATETARMAKKNTRDIGYRAHVKVVGIIDSLAKGITKNFPVPPNPSTEVHEVESKTLKEIFAPDNAKWTRVGNLLRASDVDVKINLDEIVSRHLAILSMTGMGKSNFVTVLAKEIAKREGAMIIFDYHDDYGQLELKDENGKKIAVNHIEAKITPRILDAETFADLIDIPSTATRQRAQLEDVFAIVQNNERFWEQLEDRINRITQPRVEDPVVAQPAGNENAAEARQQQRIARGLLARVRRANRLYSNVIDPRVEEPRQSLRPHSINILNARSFNEKQADVGLGYYLQTTFDDRKDAAVGERDIIFETPVLFVIEEAHTFIREKVDTESKYMAGKIAKEARKFGMGLCIVSQRPSKVSEDVLSQMGSFAVLKMIQKRDQEVVSNTSEDITEELSRQLTSLNSGESLLTGRFVKIPTLAKIDDVSELKGFGSDISATEGWAKAKKMKKTKSSQELIDKDDI
tara:strand:+ start:776 stop:2341 length:1566 start_codon:yes stop_codon:yes gene_type:complete